MRRDGASGVAGGGRGGSDDVTEGEAVEAMDDASDSGSESGTGSDSGWHGSDVESSSGWGRKGELGFGETERVAMEERLEILGELRGFCGNLEGERWEIGEEAKEVLWLTVQAKERIVYSMWVCG